MIKRLKQRWKLVTVVAIVILIALFLIFRPKGDQISYVTSNATKGNITVNVTASGTTTVNKQQNAGFRVAGKIAEIDVKVGDTVKAGQVLAKLDTGSLQNQVALSQSSLNQANNNLKNKYVNGHYTTYDIANLKEAISSAQIKLNTDVDNLNNGTLTSNFDGIVANINNSAGDMVSATGSNSANTSAAQASAVMTVIDPNSLIINVSVGETEIAQIKAGQIVQISFDALGNKKYVGKVQSADIIGTITSNVVSYNVKISIDKIDQDIKPGMTANASILVENKDNVILVPNSAIKTVSGQKTVQILQNNQPVSIPVQIGLSNDTNTEITQGINEGDNVITSTINSSQARPNTSTFGGFGGGGGGGNARNVVIGR